MSRLALAVGSAALSLAIFSAIPASTAGATTPGVVLAGVGSDTTYYMMQAIGLNYNKVTKFSLGDTVVEVPPIPGTAAGFPASVTVPGDGVAPAYTWDNSDAAHTMPNGSGAGLAALKADTTGEIDFSRSSGGPAAADLSTTQFWAYALGAVDVVKFPGSNQPKKLTRQNLKDIYTCSSSTHAPAVTNWSQINPKLKPKMSPKYNIVRYIPQPGSGTRKFFETNLLGITAGTVEANCDASHVAIQLEEHDASGVIPATKKNAIFIYDWGKWKAQHVTHAEPHDLTNGSTLAAWGITAKTAVIPSAKNVNETKKRFNGTRYLYNVNSKANHPVAFTSQKSADLRFFGVRPSANGGPGFICSGKAFAAIKHAGFIPLAKFPTGAGLPSSECRLNPKPL